MSGGNTGKLLSVSPQKVCKSLGKVGDFFVAEKSKNLWQAQKWGEETYQTGKCQGF